jgi:hypothetical protein
MKLKLESRRFQHFQRKNPMTTESKFIKGYVQPFFPAFLNTIHLPPFSPYLALKWLNFNSLKKKS